jgi:Flp pilus assembly protein TadG
MPMRQRRSLRSLGRDRSGLAMMEFAFTFPIVMAMGGYGTELSFLALTNLRVSQYALNLADNASRVGASAGAGVSQLREADINDVLQGTRKEGEGIKLTTNGRVTLSSLENTQQTGDTARVQRIHWQRCIGLMNGTGYDSSYGTTLPADGTTSNGSNKGTAAPTGMGDPGRKVMAMQDSGVMFVEVNYRYKPLFGSMFVDQEIVHYTASFMVRDNRDFSRVYNPTPTATLSTCNKYTV